MTPVPTPVLTTVLTGVRRRTYQLPRALHPAAWWGWALGLTVAANRTTNPLLLAVLLGVVSWVVLARRSDAPWAGAFRMYLVLGAVIVLVRVVFRVLFGGDEGGTILVPLPGFDLPGSSGIRVLGGVSAESLLSGLYDGMRLATMVVCLGAANCLANPRRLLKIMPPALHEVSTALVVAVSVFPQLAESVVRVRAARQLRPAPEEGRVAGVRSVLVPVLEDALERSLALASAMDSRGYGRSGDRDRRETWTVGVLMVTGLCGMCVGVYALLDATTPRYLATPMLLLGVGVGVAGIWLSGRGVRRTSYRPDTWRSAELVTVACGITAAAVVLLVSGADRVALNPSVHPLTWPVLATLPTLGLLVGLLPAFVTPLPAPVEAASA